MYQALLEIKEDLGEGQMQSSKGKPSIQKLFYVKIRCSLKAKRNELAGIINSISVKFGAWSLDNFAASMMT